MENSLNINLKLLEYIVDKPKLYVAPDSFNHSMRETLNNCITYGLNKKSTNDENKLLEIESVIDFLNDELNTGHWSNIPIKIRQYFTISSYIKCLIHLKNQENCNEDLLKKCLKCLDLGLILGAPLDNNSELLTNSAKHLRVILNKYNQNLLDIRINVPSKRSQEVPKEFLYLTGKLIDSIECPSLEYFNKHYFIPQFPVKLKDCMNHWPAVKKWLDINYLLNLAGDRTIPIEIGSHYVDENWTQKLMTFREFILKHYLSDTGDIGYLAQYNLFEQISELKEDICIPEYCCLSLDYENCMDPDINAWLGPKGTVSPLHQDPKNNILAQVYGTKQIILFSPKDTTYLYPHTDKLLNNTAQVNPITPDLEKYPEFHKATMYKCLLEPGEALFIPIKWWHHVTALDKSFSVSFWWQ